ncbi:MAG: rhodanese-like domain-containing protein [Clostridium sp.]|nr:rhodanese-like domain-containing protein [Clostridium sp.]
MSNRKVIYHELAPEDAKQWMDAMKPEEFTLLDVRTPVEYSIAHIEGAILIPENELQEKMKDRLSNKEKPIFVYCRSGVRSKKAAQILANAGYRKVYEFGGIIDWKFGTVTDY